jgi:hypothetical protein
MQDTALDAAVRLADLLICIIAAPDGSTIPNIMNRSASPPPAAIHQACGSRLPPIRATDQHLTSIASATDYARLCGESANKPDISTHSSVGGVQAGGVYTMSRYNYTNAPVYSRPVTSGHIVVGFESGELVGFGNDSFAQDRRASRNMGATLAADGAGQVFLVRPVPADADQSLKLLRLLANGAGQIARLNGTCDGMACCAMSTDGSTVMVGYASGKLAVWDTAECMAAPQGPGRRWPAMPSATWVAALVLLRLPGAAQAKPLAAQQSDAARAAGSSARHASPATIITGASEQALSCCLSADGRLVAAGSPDGSVHIWRRRGSSSQPELTASLQLCGSAAATACEFSQGGPAEPSHLAIGCADGSVWLSALPQQPQGQLLQQGAAEAVRCISHQHPAAVRCCSFSADGHRVRRRAGGGVGYDIGG